MPYGDGTGPAGMGPRTGRGTGRCCGGFGLSYGWDGRFGRGMQRFRYTMTTKGERKELLEAEISDLKEELRLAEEELRELEK